MHSPNRTLSKSIRVQAAALLNLADAIDQYAKAQCAHTRECDVAGFIAAHAVSDTASSKEDYSDLMPNPPEDPTAWRGVMLRRLHNSGPR